MYALNVCSATFILSPSFLVCAFVCCYCVCTVSVCGCYTTRKKNNNNTVYYASFVLLALCLQSNLSSLLYAFYSTAYWAYWTGHNRPTVEGGRISKPIRITCTRRPVYMLFAPQFFMLLLVTWCFHSLTTPHAHKKLSPGRSLPC